MDEKVRKRMQLDCLYDMFRDRVEENVIYIVYTENEAKIDTTIDHLMSIAACSFTGHHFGEHNNSNDLGNTSVKRSITPTTRDSVEKDENDYNSVTGINERIQILQMSIQHLLDEKKASHEKASQYLSKKMYPVTSYYSDLASQMRRMIETKTNQLVELLLEKSTDSKTIDLHGLNPIQATLVIKQLLKIRQDKLMIDKQGEASVDIITGWGKHSVSPNGQKVKPTILRLLKDEGYEFCHINKGALRVTIRR